MRDNVKYYNCKKRKIMESDSNNISNTLPIEQSNYISHESSPNTNYYSEHSNGAKMLPIPKTDMNTLFIKLKSNSHFKTIKDPEENAKKEFDDGVKRKDSLIFDEKIDILSEKRNANITHKLIENKMKGKTTNKKISGKKIKMSILKGNANASGSKTSRTPYQSTTQTIMKSMNDITPKKKTRNKKLNNSCVITNHDLKTHYPISKKEFNNQNLSFSNGSCKNISKFKGESKSNSKIKKSTTTNYATTNNKQTSMLTDEYDYSKILDDLKSIFGNELEYFDEDLLFSNLDESSNKGLIKGLLMLSHQQSKKIKYLNEKVTKLNNEHINEVKNKNTAIDLLSLQLNKMNGLLKEFISDNEKVEDKVRKYK